MALEKQLHAFAFSVIALMAASPASAQTADPSPSDQGPPHGCGNLIRLSGSTGLPKPTTLQFTITATGDVENITVAKSSGVPAFDKQFERCVAKWKFNPATVDGKPVEVSQTMIFKWPTGERPDL